MFYDGHAAEIRFSGVVTADDILRAKKYMWLYPYENGLQYGLCDFSEVSQLNISAEDVRTVALQDRQYSLSHQNLVQAVVAPQPHVFGIGRMWEAYFDAPPARTGVFQNRVDALLWLQTGDYTPGSGSPPSGSDGDPTTDRPNPLWWLRRR